MCRAQVQSPAPQASFPRAAPSDPARVKGYYRLMEQPADTQVTAATIRAPHRERTRQRRQPAARVLCVREGTELHCAEHPGCAGRGLSGRNRASVGTRGLHMHSLWVRDDPGVRWGCPLAGTTRLRTASRHAGRPAWTPVMP